MLVGFDPQSQYISESPYKHTAQYKDNANTRNRGRGSRTQPIMSKLAPCRRSSPLAPPLRSPEQGRGPVIQRGASAGEGSGARGAGGGAAVGRAVAGAATGEEEAAVYSQPALHRGVATQHRVRTGARGSLRLGRRDAALARAPQSRRH
jgi:hypothetical protein